MSGLLKEQSVLQDEADRLVALLGLENLLARIGEPVRVGSSAMGVMVRRDIDITIISPKLTTDLLQAFAQIGAQLMTQDLHVRAVRFRNDAGRWNTEPEAYPDGYYLGLSVRAPDGQDWTFDIWAIDQPERQPDLRHLRTLLPRLTDRNRETILTIKRDLAQAPKSADGPQSAHVYEAVLDHDVSTMLELNAWFARR